MKSLPIFLLGLAVSFLGCASREPIPERSAENPYPFIQSVKNSSDSESNSGASPQTNTPYIDQVRSTLEPEKENESPQGYTDKIKRELEQDPKSAQENSQESSLIARVQAEQKPETPEERSAILAVKEGRSELRDVRSTDIKYLFSMGAMPWAIRDIGSFNAISFSDVYPNPWPEIGFNFEYQPFHSEVYGSFGIGSYVGLNYAQGWGRFAVRIQNPRTGEVYPENSRTRFSFLAAQIALMGSYRFNALKYVRFNISGGPSFIPYIEFRDDGRTNPKDFSIGARVHAGVHLLLDWMSPSSSWEAYDLIGIKHTYLSAEFIQTFHFTGQLSFLTTGVWAGVSFEY